MRPSTRDLPTWLQRHRWDVGIRIRSLREEQGLSQVQLGERAGMDHKTVSRYENGLRDFGIDEAALLARALGVPSWRLFRDE
jgi:transcriptional regulator with XRE-family HTH domain